MSLENLAKIGKLKQHSATSEDAAKLLAAARRNLAETRGASVIGQLAGYVLLCDPTLRDDLGRAVRRCNQP